MTAGRPPRQLPGFHPDQGGWPGTAPLPLRQLPGIASGQGLAARCDQAGLIGQDDGLDAVAEVELGQYASDVDLDGSFGQVQVVGDLTVGSPGGEPDEDGLFPIGELAEQDIPLVLPTGTG